MEPVAFLSYAHLDDAGSIKELSLFHRLLQSELRIQTGLSVHIFFDKKSIGWGKKWADVIDLGLETAAFLIPILTPAFFQSEACRGEYKKFLEVERRIGRKDLILPIYYVKSREMSKTGGGDMLVDDVLTRQYRDWRELRHVQIESSDLLKEFAELASVIADTFFEMQENLSLTILEQSSKRQRDVGIRDYTEELMDKPINFENIVAYSVLQFPNLPVSQQWTRELLSDIDSNRYKSVRDIDKEVNFARSKVNEYAKRNPEIFKYSTDYITKSLIFVDSKFRSMHSISPETMEEAERAGISRY